MSSRAGPSTLTTGSHDDFDLVSLAAQLTLDDIEELESRQKSKQKAGAPITDAELALRLSAEEARASIIFNNDRTIAQRLQEFDETQNVNRRASTVKNPVLRQQPAPLFTPVPSSRRLSGGLGGWIGAIFSWFSTQPVPSASSSRPTAPIPLRLTGHNCVCCQDPIRGVEIRAPCGHYYDKACITDLFAAATKDESLFPPRCCRQPIAVASVLPHLTIALAKAFNEKSSEFGTLKRVYCANQSCSHFLGPQNEGWFTSTLTCPAPNCTTRTCNGCKGKVEEHTYHTCKKDQGEKDVLALSKASGWARCPSCSQMIELAHGCYHMTCLCKAEFCYLCQKKWKTCGCAQWDERRLVAAAEARVNANFAARRPPPAPRPVPVQPIQPLFRVEEPYRPVPTLLPWATQATRTTPEESVRFREDALERYFRANPTGRVLTHTARHQTLPPATPPVTTAIVTAQASRRTVYVSSPPPVTTAIVTAPASRRTVPSVSSPTTTVHEDSHWARLVREAVDELRVNHDCLHTKWTYRRGGGQCQTCYHQLPLYLFRCSGCQTLACNRCRRNRL